jgi:hypothetical protein
MSLHRNGRICKPTRPAKTRILARALVVLAAGVLAASPSMADAQDDPLTTPASLTQALSCQSRDALGAFAELLFMQDRPPAWMRPVELPEALDGMIGLYGFALDADVSLFGEPVDHVYFMNDWAVALLPRESAERIIRAQKMERAPIEATEQHFRFVDPHVGPMIGAFAPTGDAMAKMLIGAFGGDPASQTAKAQPAPASDMLLVGCSYAAASQEEFLVAASSADKTIRKTGADLRRLMEDRD